MQRTIGWRDAIAHPRWERYVSSIGWWEAAEAADAVEMYLHSVYQCLHPYPLGYSSTLYTIKGPTKPIGRERVHYEAPPCDRLDAEMEQFLTWFNERPAIDNTLRACLAHLWFETLHPFEDGNGRLGRAVFDLALAQGATFHSERPSRLWAVSPVIQARRKEYYTELERAQKSDLDVTEWLEWCVSCVDRAYDDARICIERFHLIANFWVRHRDTALTPRQRKVLEIALSPNDTGESWLTAKHVARWTKADRVTASRDLAQLEKLGVICKDPTVGGRSTRYYVMLEDMLS